MLYPITKALISGVIIIRAREIDRLAQHDASRPRARARAEPPVLSVESVKRATLGPQMRTATVRN